MNTQTGASVTFRDTSTSERHLSPSDLPTRIQRKIRITGSACWEWTGCVNSKGYGCVSDGTGRVVLIHRYVYETLVGPIPDGLQLDHVKALGCTTKRCASPGHLEPVTGLENVRRGSAATKTHCLRGHALDGDNLIVKMAGGNKIRNCRTCYNQARRDARARAKAST
jgi:hypothetical protein